MLTKEEVEQYKNKETENYLSLGFAKRILAPDFKLMVENDRLNAWKLELAKPMQTIFARVRKN